MPRYPSGKASSVLNCETVRIVAVERQTAVAGRRHCNRLDRLDRLVRRRKLVPIDRRRASSVG